MINFGILGCGMIANIHAKAILELEGANLIGVADNSYDYAKNFADKYKVKAFNNYDEMLKDESIDAICICTPSYLHAENSIKALKSGKNVVLEKPMAITVKDANKIIKTCKKTGKILTVISQMRFSDDLVKVKDLILKGAFGKINLCDLYMKYYRSKEYFSSSPWKGRLKYDGGGALMNQGIHGIDLFQYLIGDVKKVKGKIKTVCHNIEVEDTAVATVEFDCGALGVIEASTCAYPGFEREIYIHGDEGYVVLLNNRIKKIMVDGKEETLIKEDSKGTASDPTALDTTLHKKQLTNFINTIEGKEELLVTPMEGKKAVKIIEDIYKSSRKF